MKSLLFVASTIVGIWSNTTSSAHDYREPIVVMPSAHLESVPRPVTMARLQRPPRLAFLEPADLPPRLEHGAPTGDPSMGEDAIYIPRRTPAKFAGRCLGNGDGHAGSFNESTILPVIPAAGGVQLESMYREENYPTAPFRNVSGRNVSGRAYQPYSSYAGPGVARSYLPPPIPVRAYRPSGGPSKLPGAYVVGEGILGQPKVFVPGQPLRNMLRYISP